MTRDRTRIHYASSRTTSPALHRGGSSPTSPKIRTGNAQFGAPMHLSTDSNVPVEQSCFVTSSIDRDCTLTNFFRWVATSRLGSPEGDASGQWMCPLVRCRQRFPGQDSMLRHLYRCNNLSSVEYWCRYCQTIERFEPTEHSVCSDQASEASKFARMAKGFFDSMGGVLRSSTTLTSSGERCNSRHPSPTAYEADAFTFTAQSRPSSGMNMSDEASEKSGRVNETQEPRLLIDPVLDSATAVSQAAPRAQGSPVKVDLDPRSFFVGMSGRGVSMDRQTATSPSSASDVQHSPLIGYANGIDHTSNPSSNGLAASECSDDFNASSHRTYKPTPLPDELSTPSDMSTPLLYSLLPADFIIASSEVDDPLISTHLSLSAPKNVLEGTFFSTPLADHQQEVHVKGARFGQFSIDANMALTDSVEMTSDMQHFLSQDNGLRSQERSGMSPEALVRAVLSTLQIHLDSSLHKLGLVHQSPLVSQLNALSPSEVVDRGMSTSLHIMAGGVCRSPTDLICFVHLSYAAFFVLHSEVDRESSRQLFAQAMSYSNLVETGERQSYVNMVDALWKPSHMELTDVVDLLQGGLYPSNNTSHGSRQPPSGTSIGSRETDPISSVVGDLLDEFEHAVLQHATDSDLRSSALYCRHLRDFELETHRSQPFIMAVTLFLRALSHRFSDVPKYVDSILDMLSRVSMANFATTRRVELEAFSIGRLHLDTNRFLRHYVPFVRSQLDPLYARNATLETQRLSYRRDGSMLMWSLFRTLMQGSRPGGPTLFTSGTSSAMSSVEAFPNAMTSNLGEFGFHGEPTPCATPGFPYANVASAPGLHTHFDLNSLSGQASTSPAANPSPSPSVSQGTSAGTSGPSVESKVESDTTCTLCGYRPKGDPKWFGGSMAKHMKLQHATTPPKIYRCPFPGCTSQFQKRPDNLRQHQIEKGHFVDGQSESSRRQAKRKKV